MGCSGEACGSRIPASPSPEAPSAAMSRSLFMLLALVMVLVMLGLFLMLFRFGLGDKLVGFRGAFGSMRKFFLEHALFGVSLGFGARFFVARLGELLRQGADLFIGEFGGPAGWAAVSGTAALS